MSTLATSKDIEDRPLWDTIYKNLYAMYASESNALYKADFAKCKTAKQRKNLSGCYKGAWFRLFDDWLAGKIANVYAVQAINTKVLPLEYV